MQGFAVEDRRFEYQQTYPCPICRHGQIAELVLMEAMACNFCHHIFTVNLAQQSLQAADSSQPLIWRWMGNRWRPLHHPQADLTGLVWFMAIILVSLPGGIVALLAYMFPPPVGQSWDFPMVWAVLTFTMHLGMVFWLLAEYHQYPFYVELKVRLQMWQRQL